MKLFECQHCGAPLYFESLRCESCGHALGYLAPKETVTAIVQDGNDWRALVDTRRRYRYCANVQHNVCNWLVPANRPEPFCEACRHNRMIPDLSVPGNPEHWQKIEVAKHRLFYTLMKLRLPLATKAEDPNGLAFDFLAQTDQHGHTPVLTGHTGGLITINLAEADDVERERQRSLMGEPYRTLLGHFRHEIAHYYWDRIIANTPAIDEFRNVFGDERQDYNGALQQHYNSGPQPDWQEQFVSAYAGSHPWEDFAETWAHYFHMVDTLETAGSLGIRVNPRLLKGGKRLVADINFNPHIASMERLIESWIPLTVAINSINRSMGVPDLYPFVLTPAVIAKIAFVHAHIHAQHGEARAETSALRAIVAGLKRGLPQPK